MGTKYLARTVIEGGRTYYNTWQRRASHRTLRARDRVDLSEIAVDPALADARAEAVLRPVRKQFHDKLGPAERWLASRIGRSWDRVRSEMLRRFDPRTIPGQHIVHDHMLPWVSHGRPDEYGHARFVVDDRGILREGPRRPRYRRPPYAYDFRALQAWLAGRLVRLRGGTWFWFVPTYCYKRVAMVPALVPTGHYRQDRPLTDGEVRRFCAFSPAARRRIEKERAP